MTEAKRKARPDEPSAKRLREPAGHVVLRRLSRGPTGTERTGSMAELQAELTVTRICDSILGRLDDAKAQEDRDVRRKRLRRLAH